MSVELRELKREDLVRLNSWRNSQDLISQLGTNFRYISYEIDERWFENYLTNRDKNIRLSIIVNGNYVGNVNLTQIDLLNRSAEFSIMIGDFEYRGKGVGRKASELMIEYGLKELGLQRIWLTCLEDNIVAQNLYGKLGFKVEGVMREALFKGDSFKNLLLMSLLKTPK